MDAARKLRSHGKFWLMSSLAHCWGVKLSTEILLSLDAQGKCTNQLDARVIPTHNQVGGRRGIYT